jgi:hypothetical protein
MNLSPLATKFANARRGASAFARNQVARLPEGIQPRAHKVLDLPSTHPMLSAAVAGVGTLGVAAGVGNTLMGNDNPDSAQQPLQVPAPMNPPGQAGAPAAKGMYSLPALNQDEAAKAEGRARLNASLNAFQAEQLRRYQQGMNSTGGEPSAAAFNQQTGL